MYITLKELNYKIIRAVLYIYTIYKSVELYDNNQEIFKEGGKIIDLLLEIGAPIPFFVFNIGLYLYAPNIIVILFHLSTFVRMLIQYFFFKFFKFVLNAYL